MPGPTGMVLGRTEFTTTAKPVHAAKNPAPKPKYPPSMSKPNARQINANHKHKNVRLRVKFAIIAGIHIKNENIPQKRRAAFQPGDVISPPIITKTARNIQNAP